MKRNNAKWWQRVIQTYKSKKDRQYNDKRERTDNTMPKEKEQKHNNDLQNITQKLRLSNQNPTKNGGELSCLIYLGRLFQFIFIAASIEHVLYFSIYFRMDFNWTHVCSCYFNYLCRHPVVYNAYFGAGSDPEFTVTPQTGELLPQGTNGTLLKINFLPWFSRLDEISEKYSLNSPHDLIVNPPTKSS